MSVIGGWEFNIRYFHETRRRRYQEKLAFHHVRPVFEYEFGNIISIFRDKHEFYRALIVNNHMRSCISPCNLTGGVVLGLGDHFQDISAGVSRIRRILDKVKELRLVKLLRNITGLS
jgi:hypothetical protein